jgi:hypothetical protein
MAKKSMIEREKKRINLTNKYTEKRKNLLIEYKMVFRFIGKDLMLQICRMVI